jgi:hypothetical protein
MKKSRKYKKLKNTKNLKKWKRIKRSPGIVIVDLQTTGTDTAQVQRETVKEKTTEGDPSQTTVALVVIYLII